MGEVFHWVGIGEKIISRVWFDLGRMRGALRQCD